MTPHTISNEIEICRTFLGQIWMNHSKTVRFQTITRSDRVMFAKKYRSATRTFDAHDYCEVEPTYVSSGEFWENCIDSGDYAPNRLNGSIDVQD